MSLHLPFLWGGNSPYSQFLGVGLHIVLHRIFSLSAVFNFCCLSFIHFGLSLGKSVSFESTVYLPIFSHLYCSLWFVLFVHSYASSNSSLWPSIYLCYLQSNLLDWGFHTSISLVSQSSFR